MTVQDLLKRYDLGQRDLAQALREFRPSIGRVYAHHVWHGRLKASVNTILAMRQAFPQITDAELFEVLKDRLPKQPLPQLVQSPDWGLEVLEVG